LQSILEERGARAARIRDVTGGRRYVAQLDLLLLNSSNTRGDLNEVITAVRHGTVTRVAALSRIEDVIDDRRTLLQHVTTQPTPDEFRAAQRSLRAAIAVSIDVDRAALAYVEAVFVGNVAVRDNAFRAIVAGSRQATAEKANFARRYNAAGAQLGLGPFTRSF
jgi:hypothetical protein